MNATLRKSYLSFAVLLALFIVVLHSLAQPEKTASDVVVLRQEQLPVKQQGVPLSERIGVESIDGTAIALNHLPASTSAKVEHMASCVVPRIDFSDVDPKEAIRFIVRKPKPKGMIRLGLVSDHQERESDPVWLDDLQLGSKTLSCTFTNASLLDISVLFAESLDCEFGVAPEGEVVFRNKTQQAKAKHPAYILKRRLAESK